MHVAVILSAHTLQVISMWRSKMLEQCRTALGVVAADM